ncbi:DUF4123 domain-containing protein [Halopseudomonas sp.]|uniref:DUF4123 domain-containing protein n=1 Tax=Halopseudomonas sp. TaxID=2901191 RepID=UPI003001E65A
MIKGQWLLLERTEHVLPELYQLGEDPDPIQLFDGTELEACSEQSPILIRAWKNPNLLAAVQREPADWAGLLLESASSVGDLLAHLRHILFVRFDAQRRGVLRYSNPRTASYFFPACDRETLSIWLGPIDRVSWYGGTWREKAEGAEDWHSVEHQLASVWRSSSTAGELHLNPQQESALQQQQGEHFLFQWWKQQPQVPFATAWTFLKEGMQAGFVSAESLTVYLNLRTTYPHATPPASIPIGSDKERLDNLAQQLAACTNDKESTA